jgi:hypothetical protein
LSYSAVIYINSPDVVLRRAARVALNIVWHLYLVHQLQYIQPFW